MSINKFVKTLTYHKMVGYIYFFIRKIIKKIYLILSICGFIAPNILVAKVSVETGNWLFWLDPIATVNGMFPNDIANAFIIDLLFAVFVFFLWSYSEAKQLKMKNVWCIGC